MRRSTEPPKRRLGADERRTEWNAAQQGGGAPAQGKCTAEYEDGLGDRGKWHSEQETLQPDHEDVVNEVNGVRVLREIFRSRPPPGSKPQEDGREPKTGGRAREREQEIRDDPEARQACEPRRRQLRRVHGQGG